MKRIGVLSILGVATLLFALGCGASEPEESAVPAAPAPAPATAPAPAAAPAPVEAEPMGVPSKTSSGEIVVAIDTVHDSADTRIGSRPVWQQYKTLSHDMLLDVDPVKGTLIPGVAESWESSPDGLAWTFNLRKGMNFQDGHEVTAEDVKFGFEWQLSEPGNCCAVRYLDIVSDIEIVDDYTVIWHLAKVSPLLNFEISSLVEPISVVIPKHYIEDNGIDINSSRNIMDKTPLGSGTWVVSLDRSVRGILTEDQAAALARQHRGDLREVELDPFVCCSPDSYLEDLIPMAAETEHPIAIVDDRGRLMGEVHRGALLAGMSEAESDAEDPNGDRLRLLWRTY